MVRISGGSLFQSLGPATEKARSPQCLYRDLRTSSKSWFVDLRTLFGWRKASISVTYSGARPLRALKTDNNIFKSTLKETGSQWTSFCFPCLKSICLLLFVFVPRQGCRHSSFRPSPCQVGVGVRRDRRESSCPPIAGDIRRRLWLSQARRLVA